MEKYNYPIDIVITWVDGNDPIWQEERDKYVSALDRKNKSTCGNERYLDDGLLQYIFRGIERFVPWVNKIHFVTWGHLPNWLDTKHPKLHIVNHVDFMPKEYLPTFAGNPLSLNFHRIDGLAEHFIYVNDDMYFLRTTPKEVFFKKGLPCDMAVQEVIDMYSYHDVYFYSVMNDITLLNHLANKKKAIRGHPFKWFNYRYGLKYNFKNISLLPYNLFSGIYEPHTPAPYLKSTYEDVWAKIEKELDDTSRRKVRSPYNCSENIFRYYQMAKGEFYPINRNKYGMVTTMNARNLPSIIKEQKFNMICINYSDSKSLDSIKESFDIILPNKSGFEL